MALAAVCRTDLVSRSACDFVRARLFHSVWACYLDLMAPTASNRMTDYNLLRHPVC